MYLSDCINKDPALTELFIVQSNYFVQAKEARDRMGQAVLPVDDSIAKIKGSELGDLLDDDNIKSIIASLGVGISMGRGRGLLDLSCLRYGKVIIVCDETAAGIHIRAQIVTFFKRFNRPIMDRRRIFVPAQSVDASLTPSNFELQVMDRATRSLVEITTGEPLPNEPD